MALSPGAVRNSAIRWLAIPLIGWLDCGAALGDTPAWVGIWSGEPEWCVNAAFIGSRTPAPVELTPDEFLGYENSCRIVATRRIGGLDVWQFTVECQSEGSTYDDGFIGLLEGRDVLWLLWGREPVKFTRCQG